MRRCLACRASKPQAELIRLVRDAKGEWQLDESRKAPGRGAWLCRDKPECHEEKALKRSLRAQAGRVAGEVKRFFEAQEQPKPSRVRIRMRNGGDYV
jgi:uncharacterized protein